MADSAEHFVFAHSRIHVLLSLLFSAFVMHGYCLRYVYENRKCAHHKKTRLEIPATKTITDLIALVTASSKSKTFDYGRLLVYA